MSNSAVKQIHCFVACTTHTHNTGLQWLALILQNRVYAWTFFQHHVTEQLQSVNHTKPVTCIVMSRDGKTAVTGKNTSSESDRQRRQPCIFLLRDAVMRCLCVRPSRSWIVLKGINISSHFSPSGSQAILVFPYQTTWQYSDGNPHNGGVERRWGRQKSRFWALYTQLYSPMNGRYTSLRAVNCSSGKCSCDGPWRVYNISRW